MLEAHREAVYPLGTGRSPELTHCPSPFSFVTVHELFPLCLQFLMWKRGVIIVPPLWDFMSMKRVTVYKVLRIVAHP